MKDSTLNPDVASTNRSIDGKGYGSFRQASLRMVQSMHMHQSSFSFFTNTTLESHSGYHTSQMILAFDSLLSSPLTSLLLLDSILHFLYYIGWAEEAMGNEFGVNPRHLTRALGKYIHIYFNKLNEHLSDLRKEVLTNLDHLPMGHFY